MSGHSQISKEEAFLIALCRMEFSDIQKEALAGMAEAIIDWGLFARLANDHGVTALVFNNLEQTRLMNRVPSQTLTFLKNASFMSLARNTGNMKMMQEVLDVLNSENVKTVLLKGMALELMVYGNHGLRQMSDADVLIDRKHILRANNALMLAGYVPLPVKSIFHKPIIAYLGKHLPSLVRNGFSVELHHELFGLNDNSLTQTLYDTAEEISLNGRKAYVPRVRILFLYLIRHLEGHELNNDSQLRLYTDLVVLVEKFAVDILDDDLVLMAEKAGMKAALATKLLILREYWGINYPGWLNEYVDLWKEDDSAKKFVFFLKSPKGNPVPDKSVPYREIFKHVPGFHRKALYLLGDLFPTISFMKKRYNCNPGLMAILYYPHRWGKILWLLKS